VYTLTFSLTGFNTITRQGLELAANFTAPSTSSSPSAPCRKSITVSGASPVVDVQSNVKQQVLSRDVLDAVPTPRPFRGSDSSSSA
jgi:hypothetical protein